MKGFFDPSQGVLEPRILVKSFTGKTDAELALPRRAIITFSAGDLKRLTQVRPPNPAWRPFRTIYSLTDSVIALNSPFGGPNIAALTEELSAFGVREFIMWGYCGGITLSNRIGDIYLAGRALREDGISYHYIENDDELVSSEWAYEWRKLCETEGFKYVDIWSTDAIYRETHRKITDYAQRGISAVEMECASLYAVCKAKDLKAAAFFVISDIFKAGSWQGGFHTRPFKEGVKKLARFMTETALNFFP